MRAPASHLYYTISGDAIQRHFGLSLGPRVVPPVRGARKPSRGLARAIRYGCPAPGDSLCECGPKRRVR